MTIAGPAGPSMRHLNGEALFAIYHDGRESDDTSPGPVHARRQLGAVRAAGLTPTVARVAADGGFALSQLQLHQNWPPPPASWVASR